MRPETGKSFRWKGQFWLGGSGLLEPCVKKGSEVAVGSEAQLM